MSNILLVDTLIRRNVMDIVYLAALAALFGLALALIKGFARLAGRSA